ncbi:MAG: divergent polysaccharide deacetylase family protein [Syntrophobacteraceae bacterium]
MSSLIYLARESRRLPDPSAGLPVVKTDNGSKSQTRPSGDQAGEASSDPGKPRDLAAEQSEKKTESSPLGSGNADESPRRRDLPPLAMNRPAPRPGPPPPDISPKHARVSIVIDDFGPDLGVAKQFASLPFPVTMSVLPHQAHSREIAELAHRKGREVILHLPMEPLDSRENPGRGALLLSMSGDEIRRNISAALDTSPYFDGVNNHMGSRMTRDVQIMKTVLLELKGRDLFFLDSMTTNESKGWKVAMELKMPTLKRDVFLDDNPSADAVRSQISRLVKIAKVRGTALAIGHPHEATLKALQEVAGHFREEGIEVVAARDLMNH